MGDKNHWLRRDLLLRGLRLSWFRAGFPQKPGQTVLPSLINIFRDQEYPSLALGIYFMEWALFVPITCLTSFALSTSAMTQEKSYQLIAIMNAGSCIGRSVPGYIADKLDRFNSMIAALVLCTAVTVILWLPASILTTDASSPPHRPSPQSSPRRFPSYTLSFLALRPPLTYH